MGAMGQGPQAAPESFGPEIAFDHTFPSPGLYKIWAQVATNEGHVVTSDFVVRVK